MAGSTKTITLKFTGDVDDLVAKVGEADGALKLLNTSAGNTDGFDKLSKDSGKAADDVTEKWAGTATKWTSIIVGALGVGAPLVAGAATALGVAAIGAIGVALVKGSDDVKNSWNDLTQTFLDQGEQSASVITGPISSALDSLSTLAVRERPNFDQLFSGVATDIPPLEKGVESLVDGAMPGLVSMFKNSEPIIDGVGTVLGSVGNAVGSVFTSISDNAPTIKKDLDELAPTIENLGSTVGNLITLGSDVGTVVNPVLEGLSTLLKDITADISGDHPAKFDYNNPIFGTAGQVGDIKGKLLDTGYAAKQASDSVDATANAVIQLSGNMQLGGDSADRFKSDITTLTSATSNAKDAAQAFSDLLSGLGQHGQEQVNDFIASATDDLNGMASAFKGLKAPAVDANGEFDRTTKSGAALQQQLSGAQSSLGDVVGAMSKMGDSTQQINDYVTTFDGNLESNLINNLKLSKTQADAVITSLGLWPQQVDSTLGIIDQASPLIKDIGGEINNIPDHQATINAAVAQASSAVLGLGSQILGVPDGYFNMYGNTDPATQAVNGWLGKYRNQSINVYVNPIVTGALGFGTITGGRATGGPVWRGNSYLVGENGPEWFTPNASGSITSNSDTANGTGAASATPRTIETTINLSDQISVVVQSQLDANFRVISQKVKAGVR